MSKTEGKGIDVKQAWDAALQELGSIEGEEEIATPNEEPEVEDQADDTPADDTEEPVSEEGPTKLSDLIEEEEQPKEDSKPSLDLDTVVELPNVGEKTLRELMEGYLRQSDYTQKTQTLAEQRKEVERAIKLYDLMREDTVGTIASLAVEAGLVDEGQLGDAKPSSAVAEFFKEDRKEVPPAQDIEAIVAEKVAEALGQNEQIQQMQQQDIQNQIISDLNDIEKNHETTLDEDDRRAILQTALKENNPNLEHVYLRMQARLQKAQAVKQRMKDGSTPRPGQRVPKKDITGKKPASVKEAWEWAVAQHQ
jgi:hypothetical protein